MTVALFLGRQSSLERTQTSAPRVWPREKRFVYLHLEEASRRAAARTPICDHNKRGAAPHARRTQTRAREIPPRGPSDRAAGLETSVEPRRTASNAETLYLDTGATLDSLREAVTTTEDTYRIARRAFGGVHPTTVMIEHSLEEAGSTLARALA